MADGDATAPSGGVAEAARQEAADLLQQAETDAAVLRREAEQRGYLEGQHRALQSWAGTLQSRAQQSQRSRERIVDIGIEVARRILGEEIERRDDWLERQLEELLTRVPGLSEATFVVHPREVAAVTTFVSQFSSRLRAAVQADESLEPGDCLLYCDQGVFDARLETQLAALRAALLDNE